MFDFLYVIIGWIMKLCYNISFNNYIITLFIFALVMQIILFPFGIKQQKSSVKLASIRPKEMAIRQKYKGRNDRVTQQKMQMEIQELYKAEGYSPTAGCLPLLVQMPIILALFGVVRMPITYTTSIEDKDVKQLFIEAYQIADNQYEVYSSVYEDSKGAQKDYYKERMDYVKAFRDGIVDDNLVNTSTEMELIQFMQYGVDTFMKDFGYKNGVYTKLDGVFDEENIISVPEETDYTALKGDSFKDKLLYKEGAISASNKNALYDFNAILEKMGTYTAEDKEDYENGAHSLPNFKFIGGTNTLTDPEIARFDWLLLVPVLVFISSFFSSEISRKLTTQPAADPNQPNPANSGFMRWMMPAMSTYFAFSFPAAIGIYWVFRSIFSVGQQFILVKMYPAPKFTEEDMKKAVSEVKQAKKRKKIVTIEVDEDDTTYDSLAISEERAEKIRQRKEKQDKEAAERAAQRAADRRERRERRQAAESSDSGEGKTESMFERPNLKDDSDRKE